SLAPLPLLISHVVRVSPLHADDADLLGAHRCRPRATSTRARIRLISYYERQRCLVRSGRCQVDVRSDAVSHEDHLPCVELISTDDDFRQQSVTWKLRLPTAAVNSG